jgi:histidine triad (HIT) family protein
VLVSDCIFCRIVAGQAPAQVVARRDGFLAFHDVAPKAPVHVLVIPEHHVTSLDDVAGLTAGERAEMLVFIAETARGLEIDDSGYRVTTNHGPHAHQGVFHLHWHILGGEPLSVSM